MTQREVIFRQLTRVISVVILVLCIGVGESHALPRWFDFETKLHSQAARNQKRTLRRGALLYPMVPDGRDAITRPGQKALYQPIVLCENLELQSNEEGVSQSVRVEGFCYAPKLTAGDPHGDFEWTITAEMAPEVAISATCEEARIEKEKKKPLYVDEPIFSVPCDKKSFTECQNEFTIYTEEKYGKSLDETTRKDGICHVTPRVEKLRIVGYSLVCDH